MQKTIFLLTTIFLLIGQTSSSQTRNDSLDERYKYYIHGGDSCFAVEEYVTAAAYYTAALMIRQNDKYATSQKEKAIRDAAKEKPKYHFHAIITGMNGGEITVNQLLNDSVFTVTEGIDIISFRMTIYRVGSEPIEIDTNGNRLTDKMCEAISRLHKGAKLHFEFKAEYFVAANASPTVEPMTFTIK